MPSLPSVDGHGSDGDGSAARLRLLGSALRGSGSCASAAGSCSAGAAVRSGFG